MSNTILEEKIIFLENDIEKLNMAMYQQDKKIADLEKLIHILHTNISTGTTNNQQNNNEIPPHY